MKNIYLILSIFFSLNTFSQVSLDDKDRMIIPVELYRTTNDFINNEFWTKDCRVILSNELKNVNLIDSIKKYGDTLKIKPKFLQIKDFINKKTNQEFSNGRNAWALKYNNDYFVNLGYSVDLTNWDSFIKLDVIGRYCLFFVSSESYLNDIADNQYGLGLVGVLGNTIGKPKNSFVDKNNKKYSIHFIDTNELHKHGFGSKSFKVSISFLLTKRRLKKIIEKNNLELNAKELSFEEVIELFKGLNKTMPNTLNN